MSANKEHDFLEIARKNGKIRNIKEAFKDYPVEEEWHQGRIETVFQLREESEEYYLYEIGDIVFVNEYTYDDGNQGKNHLFVIVEQNNLAVPIENFGMLISSNLKKLRYQTNKLIEKDTINGLNKNSIIKTDVIYKISNSQILFKIGQVELNKVEEYKKSFYESLK